MIKIIEIGDFIFDGKYSLHSTFNNVSNFINENKNIVSIAHNDNYLSPNSILISGISHKNIKSIKINDKKIIINETTIYKKEIKVFESSINFKIIKSEAVIKRVEKIINENISEFNPLSLAFLINKKLEENFKTRFQKAFVRHIKSAWEEVEKGNLIHGIEKIKGAGIGLTPSGDDFITGMLYSLIFTEKIKKTDTTKIRESIYKAATSKNDISRTMLYHAYKGAYFKQFKDLQTAFINNDKNTKQYFKNLIVIGETSGSDMLTGFYLVLKEFRYKLKMLQ